MATPVARRVIYVHENTCLPSCFRRGGGRFGRRGGDLPWRPYNKATSRTSTNPSAFLSNGIDSVQKECQTCRPCQDRRANTCCSPVDNRNEHSVPSKNTTPSAEAAATPPKTGGETRVVILINNQTEHSVPSKSTTPSAEAAATPPKTGGRPFVAAIKSYQ